MGICTSNTAFILNSLQSSQLWKLRCISKNIRNKIDRIVMNRKKKIDFLHLRLNTFAIYKHLTPIHQMISTYIFDKETNKDSSSALCLWSVRDLQTWLEIVKMQHGEKIVEKSPDVFFEYFKKLYTYKLFLKVGKSLVYGIPFCFDVVVGRVRKLYLYETPSEPLPLKEKESVEEIVVHTEGNFDLTFLEEYKNTKLLEIRHTFGLIENTFKSKPIMKSLESLSMAHTEIIVDTENLRELSICGLNLTRELISLINSQKRLISFKLNGIKNVKLLSIPQTVRDLEWGKKKVNFPTQDSLIFEEKVKKLRLRRVLSNLRLESVNCLKKPKLNEYSLLGIERKKWKGRYKVIIKEFCYLELNVLNRTATECIIESNNYQALRLVDDLVERLLICQTLQGKKEGLPVLKNVKKITFLNKLTDQNANELTKIFPQFSAEELKKKTII